MSFGSCKGNQHERETSFTPRNLAWIWVLGHQMKKLGLKVSWKWTFDLNSTSQWTIILIKIKTPYKEFLDSGLGRASCHPFKGISQRTGGWTLTAAAEPRSLGSGSVMVASPVHTLNTLVPIDDLEDLADEGAGFLCSILAQGGGQKVQVLPNDPMLPIF